PLPGLEVLRQEQDAVGEDVREDVEHDLVAGPVRLIVELPGAGVDRHRRVRELADDLAVEVVPIPLAGLLPLLRGGGVGLLPELLADPVRVPPELLRERDELVELPLATCLPEAQIDDGVIHLVRYPRGEPQAGEYASEIDRREPGRASKDEVLFLQLRIE